MSPRPIKPCAGNDKNKANEALLTELADLRGLVTALRDEKAGCDRIIDMLDGIMEPVLVLDDASQVVYANSAAARLFTKDRGAVEGRGLWDLYPKSHDTLFYNAYEKARQSRSTGKFREQHRLLGKWFDVYLYPVPGGMTVLFNDITVSRQMEELPRLALTLLHNLKDIVFLMRADGRLFHVNNETQDSLGYSGDELHRMSIFDVVPASYANEWHDILDRIRQHGSMTFESLLRGKDGREFPVEVNASFIELYGNSYYTISARDISERKRFEETLARSAKDFRSIVTRNADAMIILDVEGFVLYVNPRAESLYNLSASDFTGKLFGFPLMLADPVEMYVLKEFKEFVAVEMRMVVVEWQGKPSYLLSLQDITERKKAEEALQVAKAQAELYVDLMGHDINNMNMVAMASLELALMDLEQDGKLDLSGKPLLDKSVESLQNSTALIKNVQKLQRASTEGIKLQAVDVAGVLKGIIDEQRSTPGKDLTIYYKNEASHCLITANELLRDVFTNIISNAIKHARTDRHLTIGVAVEGVIEDGRKFCRVVIDDNGQGIPDEVKDRLFRRFSRGTTKAKGSGLGLYLVKTLVEHYGGDIRVEDRVPGDHTKGAKFVVTIPSAE